MAHMRQTRPDSGRASHVYVRKTFQVVPSELGSGEENVWAVRVGGDDKELRLCHYIYEGKRGRWWVDLPSLVP